MEFCLFAFRYILHKKKIVLIFCLLFIKQHAFGQSLNSQQLSDLYIGNFYEFIFNTSDLSIDEYSYLGNYQATRDLNFGKKRILLYQGFYSNTCKSCVYEKYGFEAINFATACYDVFGLKEFMESYNSVMMKYLPDEALIEIKKKKLSFEEFNNSISEHSSISLDSLTDSTYILNCQFDSLQSFFITNCDTMYVEIINKNFSSNNQYVSLQELKTKGIEIKLNPFKDNELIFKFKINNMNFRESVCECDFKVNNLHFSFPIGFE